MRREISALSDRTASESGPLPHLKAKRGRKMATFTEEVRPLLTPAEATQLLKDHYAKVGAVRRVLPLPSYDDQNWKVIIQCAQEAIDKIYVLKIAASGAACRGHAGDDATRAALDCEHTMMRAVRSRRRAVLRCLHAIDATRVHQTRSWVVSFSISRPFGPI